MIEIDYLIRNWLILFLAMVAYQIEFRNEKAKNSKISVLSKFLPIAVKFIQ